MTVLYEYYNTGADGGYILDDNSVVVTQTFTPLVTHRVTYVKLLVYRVGSPGDVSFSIRATIGGEPDDSTELFAGSDASFGFDGNAITTNTDGEWVVIPIEPVEVDILLASILYCMTVESAGFLTVTDYIVWKQDTSSPSYSGGQFGTSIDGGHTWIMDATKDAMFEEWGDPILALDQSILGNKVSLEAIRNLEMAYGGSFYISKIGLATYESRYHRNV